jgi:hypothetical protein
MMRADPVLLSASRAAAHAASLRMGGTLLTDGWPGFETADGWRYRVAKGGHIWIAIHHEQGKTGRGSWPEQAREHALIEEHG